MASTNPFRQGNTGTAAGPPSQAPAPSHNPNNPFTAARLRREQEQAAQALQPQNTGVRQQTSHGLPPQTPGAGGMLQHNTASLQYNNFTVTQNNFANTPQGAQVQVNQQQQQNPPPHLPWGTGFATPQHIPAPPQLQPLPGNISHGYTQQSHANVTTSTGNPPQAINHPPRSMTPGAQNFGLEIASAGNVDPAHMNINQAFRPQNNSPFTGSPFGPPPSAPPTAPQQPPPAPQPNPQRYQAMPQQPGPRPQPQHNRGVQNRPASTSGMNMAGNPMPAYPGHLIPQHTQQPRHNYVPLGAAPPAAPYSTGPRSSNSPYIPSLAPQSTGRHSIGPSTSHILPGLPSGNRGWKGEGPAPDFVTVNGVDYPFTFYANSSSNESSITTIATDTVKNLEWFPWLCTKVAEKGPMSEDEVLLGLEAIQKLAEQLYKESGALWNYRPQTGFEGFDVPIRLLQLADVKPFDHPHTLYRFKRVYRAMSDLLGVYSDTYLLIFVIQADSFLGIERDLSKPKSHSLTSEWLRDHRLAIKNKEYDPRTNWKIYNPFDPSKRALLSFKIPFTGRKG